MSLIRILMVIAMLSLGTGTESQAQAVTAKGVATVTYAGKLDAAVKERALLDAKVNALDRYIATQADGAKSRNYETARTALVDSIDRYVLAATVLSEESDTKAKRYTVAIRAEVNAPSVENALVGRSAVAQAPAAQKSLMTFVFVARQQGSVQVFDDKVYKRVDASVTESATGNAQRDATESERITGNSVSTSDKVQASANYQANATASVTSGGSTTSKSDVVAWNVTRADEINSVMTGTFTAAGFEVVEAEYVGSLDVEAIRTGYGTGEDLSPAALQGAVRGVQAAGGFRYLALGRLDVGMRDKDPSTGLTRVYVTVSGKVLDVSASYPRTVSSVGPEQFAGLGPSETVARTNALKEAAAVAAERLVNELNARGVL
jgi:hypothetical protein